MIELSSIYYKNLEPEGLKNYELVKRKSQDYFGKILAYLKNAKYSLEKNRYYAEVEFIDNKEVNQIFNLKIKEIEAEIKNIYEQAKARYLSKDSNPDKNFQISLNSDLSSNEFASQILNSYEKDLIEKKKKEIDSHRKLASNNNRNKEFWIRINEPEDKEWPPIIRYQFFSKNEANLSFNPKFVKGDPLKIKIIYEFEEENLLKIKVNDYGKFKEWKKQKGAKKLYLIPNTVILIRQIDALNELINKPKPHLRALIKLIEKSDLRGLWEPIEPYPVEEFYVLKDTSRSGTQEQREFVRKALATNDFAILEGPPGSGKTTTILELILQFVKQGKRVLLVASTHVAVDNVLEKIKELRDPENPDFFEVFPLRVGKVYEKISRNVSEFTVENTKLRFIDDIIDLLLSLKKKKPLYESQKELFDLVNTAKKKYSQYNADEEEINRAVNIISSFISESVNLFCGTTIGFMAHIDIITQLAKHTQGPLFDVMILDEASKTPFSEFLVPARFAKKWIIIGDRYQLSPFLEDDFVSSYISNVMEKYYKNIENAVKDFKKKIDLKSFLNSFYIGFTSIYTNTRNKSVGLIVENNENKSSYWQGILSSIQVALSNGIVISFIPGLKNKIIQFMITLFESLEKGNKQIKKDNDELKEGLTKELNQKIELLDNNIIDYEKLLRDENLKTKNNLVLFSGNLFIGTKKDFDNILDSLPHDFVFIKEKGSKIELSCTDLLRRKCWWLKKKKKDFSCELKELRKKQFSQLVKLYEILSENIWSNEISWRLNRKFELREDQQNKRFAEYSTEIQELMPKLFSNRIINDFKKELEWLNAFVLPSIIEVLQVGSKTTPLKGTLLYNGFSSHDILKDRIVTLTFQHRMHPDISKFPREKIYSSEKLRDPPYIENIRKWGFKKGSSRFLWVNVAGNENPEKRINEKEVKAIIKHLDEFLKHADKRGKLERPNKEYTVGIITFYKGQERLLKRKIAKYLNLPESRWITYNTPINNVVIKIEICTVDRFQGKEADVIFLSMVRTKKMGFIDSPNRLNVALTRAKYLLMIFGNLNFFKNQSRSILLKELAEYVYNNNMIIRDIKGDENAS